MDVKDYIKDLLYFHDCVIIPGFGGFITNYQSSEIHKYKNVIYPPSKSVSFNRQLQSNDGLLINHIASSERVGYKIAEEKVTRFVAACKKIIEGKGIVQFPDVGKIYLNTRNNLIFLPELRKNFLLETYGLKAVSFDPYHYEKNEPREIRSKRLKSQTEPEKSTSGLRTIRKRRLALIGLAASVVFILIISQFMIWDVSFEKLKLQNLNVVSIDSQVPQIKKEGALIRKDDSLEAEKLITTEQLRKEPMETLKEEETETSPEPVEKEEEKIPVEQPQQPVQPGSGYYLIFGSFKEATNAKQLKNDLEAEFQGSTARIFQTSNGFHRVGVFAAGKKTEASAKMPQFKSPEHPNAWLFYSNN